MERWAKFIVALAIAFLAVVIGAGLGQRLAQKRSRPAPERQTPLPAQAEQTASGVDTAEGLVAQEQEAPPEPPLPDEEGALPPEYLSSPEPSSETKPPLIPGYENKYLSSPAKTAPLELIPGESRLEIMLDERSGHGPFPPAYSPEELPPE